MQILYATDGESTARDAGRLLTRLADPARAEVTILSAHDPWTEEVDRYFGDVLDDAEKQLRDVGLVSSSTRRKGEPALSIERELSGRPYDMVVVGAGNHGWLDRWAMGSVSNHVLAHSAVPVLVVHRAPDDEDRVRVLVGADGSPAVEHAIDTLMSLSGPDRVAIEVRAVIEAPDLTAWGSPGVAVPSSSVEAAFRDARGLASVHMEEALSRLRTAGFRAEGSLGEGWPANDLLERTADRRVDLLVMGAHRRGFFERLVMGSVSSHVTRHAPASLVACARAFPPEEEPIEEPNGFVSRNRFPVRWT
jgi:nucleotide-binding universal stress UspA family protein